MATKKQPAKRATPKRTPPSSTAAEVAAQEADKDAARAAANPGFSMEADGRILWEMGGTSYVLMPLTVAAFIDLDWRRRGGGTMVLEGLRKATELPGDTDDERAAKLVALEAANAHNNEWLMEWYDALFGFAERDGKPFPREHAPAWLFAPLTMQSLLGHLQGPPPPGVG